MVNGWFFIFFWLMRDFAVMFGLKEWNHKVQVLVNGTLQKSSISIWQSTITGTVLMNSLSVFQYRVGTGVCGVVLLFLEFLA